jgi:hypothetical protein
VLSEAGDSVVTEQLGMSCDLPASFANAYETAKNAADHGQGRWDVQTRWDV